MIVDAFDSSDKNVACSVGVGNTPTNIQYTVLRERVAS